MRVEAIAGSEFSQFITFSYLVQTRQQSASNTQRLIHEGVVGNKC